MMFEWRRLAESPREAAARDVPGGDRVLGWPAAMRQARRPASIWSEVLIAGGGILALLWAQWLLSQVMVGANYAGGDGKMAQATILAALHFAGFFHVTTLSPIEGLGSQLLPLNVWANPAHWPFAFMDKATATDVSAVIALGIFAGSCYVMARCFDLPVLAALITAQLCILLFAPLVLVLQLWTVFCINPDDAVVFAPHMIALGLLARLDPGSRRRFAWTALGIFALLLYSLYCDPLWTVVDGFSWAVPFVIVALGPWRKRAVLWRFAALGLVVVLLVASGALEYAYTLSQYTARVQFAAVNDRPRMAVAASALFFSPYMKYFYAAWAAGWLCGLLTLRGRGRLLAVAAAVTAAILFVYGAAYLVMVNAVWLPPVPMYLEQNLAPLFMTAAVAGYWGLLRSVLSPVLRMAAALWTSLAPAAAFRLAVAGVAAIFALVTAAALPAAAADFALYHSINYRQQFHEPWPNEPEFNQFFADRLGQIKDDGRFRGAIHFWTFSYDTISINALWSLGVPSVDEYSQLVTPQSFYFLYGVLGVNVTGALNGFVPFPGASWDVFWRTLQLLGDRYYIDLPGAGGAIMADKAGFPVTTLPRRPLAGAPGLWRVYELPRPNLGNYSPTEVLLAQTGSDIAAKMKAPGFDPTTQAVLAAPIGETLVPATGMEMRRIRGGIHVSGHSDGLSLVILPQQFSACLRARDEHVRLVRADLMLTGLVFSGDLDTDVSFGYGVFSPWCRLHDLGDIKRLQLAIPLKMAHLASGTRIPGWHEAVARLRTATAELK